MTEQETIRWLSRAYWLRLRIERMQEHRRENQMLIEGAKGIDYAKEMIRGGTPTTLEDAVLRLVDLDAKLAAEIQRYSVMVDEITAVIKSVEDERLATLLYLRYVKGERMERIACEMGYVWRHIMRLHRRALAAVCKILSSPKQDVIESHPLDMI